MSWVDAALAVGGRVASVLIQMGGIRGRRVLRLHRLADESGDHDAAGDQGRALIDAGLDQLLDLVELNSETTGPSWLLPFGSPTVTWAAASLATAIASSIRLCGTSIRVGAVQV